MAKFRADASTLQKAGRSKYESRVHANIAVLDKDVKHESMRVSYKVEKKYVPDFVLSNGILVEAKGRFLPSDRTKMLAVIAQNPKLDVRILFQNAKVKLSKASSTTYGEWATKHGIVWAEGETIPQEWLTKQHEEEAK